MIPPAVVDLIIKIGLGVIVGGGILGGKKLFKWWKGKNVVVLGARGTGKTHLVNSILGRKHPEKTSQTYYPEDGGKKYQKGGVTFKIRYDVPGDKDNYTTWKNGFDQSDIVFYLLRADKIIAGDRDAEQRILTDSRQIGGWFKERKENPPHIFIIGTHCDLDPNYAKVTQKNRGDYLDCFRKLPTMSEFVKCMGGKSRVKVHAVNLKDPKEAKQLIDTILQEDKAWSK